MVSKTIVRPIESDGVQHWSAIINTRVCKRKNYHCNKRFQVTPIFDGSLSVGKDGEKGVRVSRTVNGNRLFLSSLMSQFQAFQSESKCETILMKMTLICLKIKLHAELVFT